MNRSKSRRPLVRTLHRLRFAFLRRRVVHWLMRALWLTLLVPIAVMTGYFWQGWEMRPQHLLYGMLLVGSLVVLWSLRPISLKKIAQRLDKRLGLQTQLTTAFEVSRSPTAHAENLVAQRLLQETVQLVVHLRSQVCLFNRTFWLETRTLIGVVALLSGLLMLNTLQPRLPQATPAELPLAWREPAADEVISPDPQLMPPPFQPEIQVQALDGDQLRSALQALADALRDQASSHAIAEAIDRNDLAGAAEETRRLADRLEALSEAARDELEVSLQEAADNIGDSVSVLTEPLQAGSNALDRNDLLGTGQALEDLAEVLDAISETPPEDDSGRQGDQQADSAPAPRPDEQGEATAEAQQEQSEADQENEAAGDEAGNGGGNGDGDAGAQQPTEEERLAAEGQPLELDSDFELEERTLQPAELDAEASDRVTQDSPFTRQSATYPGDLGPDPLTYPWEKREVIRSYFTP